MTSYLQLQSRILRPVLAIYSKLTFAKNIVICRDFSASFAHHATKVHTIPKPSDLVVGSTERISEEVLLEGEEEHGNKSAKVPISTSAKLKMWGERLDTEPETPVTEAQPFEDNREEFSAINNIMDVVYNTSAYDWLLATIRKRTVLSNLDSLTFRSIRKTILSWLHWDQRTGKQSTNFTFAWQVKSLLDIQWPGWQKDRRIGRILGLTGDDFNAQATTCDAYMDQVWPATGTSLLSIISEVLHGEHGARVILPGGAQLMACEHNQSFHVQVIGPQGIVVEIAEQLCWLVSALSPMPTHDSLWYSIPQLNANCFAEVCVDLEASGLAARNLVKHRVSAVSRAVRPTVFEIAVEQSPVRPGNDQPPSCWIQLFGHAVIVHSFPILKRPQPNLGLEIPLGIVASLVGTKYYNNFNNVDWIKGFSAMIYPSKNYDEIMVWHLNVAKNDLYLSYLDCDTSPLEIATPATAYKRHIVGWSQDATHHIGNVNCKYDVKPSNTRRVSSDCALHTRILSPASLIPNTLQFQVLKDHYPRFRDWEALPKVMRRLGRHFVCFWDVHDQRGWFVDGVGALAHLVCASMISDEEETPRFMQTKLSQLTKPQEPHSFSAPMDFLCNDCNRTAVILRYSQRGSLESETLEDRAMQYYHILDNAFTYQKLVGKKLKQNPRRILEGWDFHRLIWRRDDQHRARQTIIGPPGKGWIDLLRDTNAVTLLGSGFGEIMKPSHGQLRPLCFNWQTLPTSQFYLATSIPVLRKIIKHCGDDSVAYPQKLTKHLTWYVPDALFSCCGCQEGTRCTKHVQIPWPTKHLDNLGDVSPPSATLDWDDGIVVFGQNALHDWHWPDHGPPEKGPLPPETVEIQESDDTASSIDDLVEEKMLVPWSSDPKSSLETSITTQQSSSNPISQEQNSYGNSRLDGHARMHQGNVYINKSRITYNNATHPVTALGHTRSNTGQQESEEHTSAQQVEGDAPRLLVPPKKSDESPQYEQSILSILQQAECVPLPNTTPADKSNGLDTYKEFIPLVLQQAETITSANSVPPQDLDTYEEHNETIQSVSQEVECELLPSPAPHAKLDSIQGHDNNISTVLQEPQSSLLASPMPPNKSDNAEAYKDKKPSFLKWTKSRRVQRLFHRHDKKE